MIVYFSRFASQAQKGVLIISPEPSRLVLGREPLKAAELPLKDEYLYFGNVSELPAPEQVGRTSLLLFEDKKLAPEFLERNRLNIILANSQSGYEQLCEDMRSVFDIQMQVNIFTSKLLFMVQDEAKTEKLLELGNQVFGNPLLLLDPSLCLIASAGTAFIEDDPVMEHVLSKGYMPEQYLEEVMKEESDSPEEDKVLIIWEKDFLRHRLIAGRIVRGNRLIGYLKLFEYNRPLSGTLDIEMLKALCQHLAISMDSVAAPHQSGQPFIETFLLDIIERKLVDREVINERVDLYNLELQPYKTVIVVEFEERFRKTDKLYLLKQMLQNLFKRKTVFIHGNDIVILYDRDNVTALYDEAQVSELRRLLETNYCRAAFSLPFKSLSRLYSYFTQAITSFSIADRLRITNRVLMYDDFLATHMFLRFGEVFDLHDLVTPSVKLLQRQDAQKGSNLTETLFAYIHHRQDVTETSKAMHIHYNTMKYRINRIREITGINLNDEQQIFRTILSERVIALLKRMADCDSG